MADKTKTIKGATDKELDELLARLRKESELQNLLAEIKRRTSSGYMPYDYGQEISTEKPIESLYHFGIPGMKWGHRKSNSSVTKGRELIPSEDHKRKVALKKKKIPEMSNGELQELTNRLQLENKYKTLNPKKVSKGLKKVKAITAAGTTLAGLYALTKTPLGQDLVKVVKNSVDMAKISEAEKWVL